MNCFWSSSAWEYNVTKTDRCSSGRNLVNDGKVLLERQHSQTWRPPGGNGCANSSVATVDLPAAAPSLANFFMGCCGVTQTAIQCGPRTTKWNSPNSPPPSRGATASTHSQTTANCFVDRNIIHAPLRIQPQVSLSALPCPTGPNDPLSSGLFPLCH